MQDRCPPGQQTVEAQTLSNPVNLSYAHGADSQPLSGMTVGQALDQMADQQPDAAALIIPYKNIRWTYARLKSESDMLAAGLLELGLKPGDRIGMWAPNCAEWVVTQFATAKAGLILVNVNPAYRLSELKYALNQVGATALITAPKFKSSDYIALLNQLMPELPESEPGELSAAAVPSLRWVIGLGSQPNRGMMPFDSLVSSPGPEARAHLQKVSADLQFDDPINIQFTSGTTGTPKAATLTHHNIVNNALFVGRQMELTAADRMCIPVPMYHCFGMVLGTLCCIVHGATIVFASEGFDASAVVEMVESESCTVLHGVPTMFIAALDLESFNPAGMATLRTGIIAGAPCPVELMKRLMRDMHLDKITIAYGMTETGPVSTQTSVEDTVERRVETVGRVMPHTEIKIVDKAGRVTPRGEQGELLTRGYCVMPRYWNDAERTASAIDDGRWIASGDLATMDDAGYVRIVGRIKDMLIRGGENIYPREIEEFVYTHPDVEEVEVFGVPDAKFGEEVAAWIRLRDGATLSAEDIRAFCEGHIAHFKIPRYIRFVDAFPMTVTGKVQKYVMREEMTAELAQETSG
jgi:fatty-acyl-CoA synthase